MQLIIESESTVDIQKDMSAIEEPSNKKVVVNGEVEDLNDMKCNGNKENLVNHDTITVEECTKVNNIKIIDNPTTKALANVEDVLLDNNDQGFEKKECENSVENCAQNDDSDALIHESLDDNLNEEKLNNSDESHIAEELKEELIEDDIVNINVTNNVVPEILDSTKIGKDSGIEESPVKKEDLMLEKTACLSGDDIANIGDKLVLMEKDDVFNNLNNTQDIISKDIENAIEENIKFDVDKVEEIDEGISNEICEIPDMSDDVKSDSIELNEEIDVEEVPVEPNNDTCGIVDQVKSELIIESQNDVGPAVLADADKEKASNTPNVSSLNKEMVSAPILEDKVDVDKSMNSLKTIEIISEISRIIHNTPVNKDSKQSTPNESHEKILVDDVECVSEEIKDESIEESSIVVQDEMDVEEIKEVQEIEAPKEDAPIQTCAESKISDKPVICKLSNTLDILSDDDEEPPRIESQVKKVEQSTKEIAFTQEQSINIEDDDDIMLIDEDVPTQTELNKHVEKGNDDRIQSPKNSDTNSDMETGEKCNNQSDDLFFNSNRKESILPAVPAINSLTDIDIKEKPVEKEPEKLDPEKPLLPENFLLSAKKNLADMTREDLEEFCILKIVESIVDRSSLGDIKAKLKAMTLNIEEYRKKAMMLTKQNRDLQVVLKSVQEEQKKMTDLPITPLKITRSVGMQVLMADKLTARRKTMLGQVPNTAANNANRQHVRPTGPSPRGQKLTVNPTIPVPRLVPANSPSIKSPNTVPMIAPTNTPNKIVPNPVPNGIKTTTQKAAEKRQHNRIQSVTVDLTDDEPPTKMSPRNSPATPVRLVPPQNLMPPHRQPYTPAAVNSPRKVYIPISGPQNQAIRSGQAIMLKPVAAGPRPRCAPPQPPRMQNPVRRVTSGRHPAPLPDAMKQYQPPNWKALPPAPDLRLSKVENGIVISWKIEGYQEDSYEEIASYQLYAYQETSSPPSTTLWKKIGDVKALPLPMACTLTQFMAGFKYFFAVRAVDVKSRLGPFSLPGSILLLNKL